MKVIYSAGVRLADHGRGTTTCYSAREIYKRNRLDKVFCTDFINNCIPERQVRKVFPGGIITEKILLYSAKLAGSVNGYGFKDSVYDYLVSKKIRRIDNFDIFHGWSLSCLRSLKAAKSKGAVTIVERPNSHILTQKYILESEYKAKGINREAIERIEIERNLAEYGLADYIIVPSEFARKSFEKQQVDMNKVKVLPYGFDDEIFKPKPKRNKKFRVLFVGHVSLRKGLPYLLEVWKKLKLKNAELVLVGKVFAEMKTILRKAIAGDSGIIVKEYVPYRRMPEEYNNSDLFVLPSVEDGFGLVILEAMGCGIPVIITDNTAGIDIVSDGVEGFVVPVRDSNVLAERIESLYRDGEKRASMGMSAAKKSGGFTWKRYGERLANIYSQIIGKNEEKG